MEGGDLSNEAPPRFLFVFEGLIGKLPRGQEKRHARLCRLHRHEKAAAMWEIDDQALSYLWDMAWRHHLQVDMVTFLEEYEALKERLDDEGIPYGHLRHYASPDTLAVRLSYMPYVSRIYYAYPERPFVFGDRGVYTPEQRVFDPLS